MKILVVDDEILLVKGIRFNLQNEGYEVITGSNGLEAVQQVQEQNPDLVVLDVMMPEMDGLTACSKIREFSNVPIIMLTAKTDDMDKLIGFDHGVDDYLTKPFNILELKARIRALLRRSTTSTAKEEVSNTLTIGPISLDLDARNAYRSGTLVELTAKEFDMVEFLMRNPNRVYSREGLLDTIWSYEYRSDIRTVDVHIRRLREKLEENPAEPKYIMTKWGVGYYFRK
jgi:DNA-binding response OmpR family regulator